jgi:hypothetical protein
MRWITAALVLLVSLSGAYAIAEMNVVVFPDIPSTTFQYDFIFSASSTCTPVLNVSVNITTNLVGRGNATLDTSSLTIPPAYLCTYRDGVLTNTQSLNRNAFEQGNISTSGNGTAGYAAYYTDANTINNSNLFFDSVNQWFGIGTAIPTAALQVIGTGLFTTVNATTFFQNGNAVLDVTYADSVYVNITDLQSSNTSTNTRIDSLDTTQQNLLSSNTSTNTRINTLNATKGNVSGDGNGSVGWLAKWTSSTSINNSQIYDNRTDLIFAVNSTFQKNVYSILNFTVAGSILHVDTTLSRVGIMTNRPNSTLHVIGSANITGVVDLPNTNCTRGTFLTANNTGRVECTWPGLTQQMVNITIYNETGEPTADDNNSVLLYMANHTRPHLQQVAANANLSFFYQPSLISENIYMILPGTAATMSQFGGSTALGTNATISHPAPNEWSGRYANFATAATLNATAAVRSTVLDTARGSSLANGGFLFAARVYFPDAAYGTGNTGQAVFVGLSSAQQDRMSWSWNYTTAGSAIGFFHNTNVSGGFDIGWMVLATNGVTSSIVNTTMNLTARNWYDMMLYCSPGCNTVNWEITNLNSSEVERGVISTNLPAGSTMMAPTATITTKTNTARNMWVKKIYVQQPR